MSFENRPKDFFAKQIRSSHLIASGGITNPNSSDWDESFENLRLMIYPKDALETSTPGGVSYIEGAFEGIVPPQLLEDTGGTGLKVGDDVWLFISGAQNTHSTDHDEDGVIELDEKEKRADSGVVLFGGDVVISGTLFAERQVVEVDLSQEGELFVSGNLKVQDYTPDTKFIQFMMPMENYPEQWRRRALSFTDLDSSDGTDAPIDLTSLVDGDNAGVYDLTLYSSFDTTAPFPVSSLNTTITNYRREIIIKAVEDSAGADCYESLALFTDAVALIIDMDNATDFDGTEPTPISTGLSSFTYMLTMIQTLLDSINPVPPNYSTGDVETIYDAIIAIFDGLKDNITDTINWITTIMIDHDGDPLTPPETPGGITVAQRQALEVANNAASMHYSNNHVYAAAFSAAPVTPTEFESKDDAISKGVAYSGFVPGETGDPDEELTIFNVDSLNGRVGILNVDPVASLDLRSGYGEGNTPTAHINHQVEDDSGVLQNVQLYIEGGVAPAAGKSIFWHLRNKEEPLEWSHASAANAPEVFRIVGLKEDITNYDTNDIEPKVLTITDDGYVRFKEGGLGGAKLKDDRDGREDINDLNTNEEAEDASGAALVGDDHDGGGAQINGNPYDNGYYVDRWHGDTQVGHALDDVNKALKAVDENKAWQWPDTDGIEGGDKVTLRDDLNNVGIGTQDPVQKLHVYSGDGLNTAVRLQSDHIDSGDGSVSNPAANVKIELAIDENVHSTISQNVRVGEDLTALGTDMMLQNHTVSGGIYVSTLNEDDAGNQVALAPLVIDSNGSALGTELQVLILSGTTGEDPVLDPRTFADTNFFVSGSIGSCVNPSEGVAGNAERGTAVFGGDLFVSGAIYSGGGVVGGGGGWRTAMNGVCMDVFTESAYGDDGTTPASDGQILASKVVTFDNSGNPLVPDVDSDDFSSVYLGFYSTEPGTVGDDVAVTLTLSSSTSSLDPTVTWTDSDPNNRSLDITIPQAWDVIGDDDAFGNNTGNNIRISFQRILDLVNGGGIYNYPAATWPVRARLYNTWQSENITPGYLTTPIASHNGQTITWTLNGGGDSVRYVSWGADATSGNSPSEGMAEGTGDTFTRQDWAQGLLIPFNCTIVGYSVRYMSKDPFVITAPGVTPTGAERVEWQIGELNEGTDPDPGALGYAGIPTTTKVFSPYVDGGPINWIAWHAADNGTYPMKWVGEGSDGDAGHVNTLNIPVTAGKTIAVRALEKDCDIYSDYRAEASVTIWLQGGNVSGGAGAGAGSGFDESSIRSVTTLGPSDGGAPVANPLGESEVKVNLPTSALMNYISATYSIGDHLLFELPLAASNEGCTYVIKDSVGQVSDDNTNIRIAPVGADTLDQYTSWAGGNGPLKLEQNFASITIWSDGVRWLIS